MLTVESALAGSVTATPLTVTSAGAGATCDPSSSTNPQAIAANGTVQFTYACTVTAGSAVPGSVTFKTTPTGVGTGGFVEAASNSVLATPRLTFQATVNNPATVAQIKNTAQISEVGGTIPPTPSNETLTQVPGGSIGDYVWWTTTVTGADAGEAALSRQYHRAALLRRGQQRHPGPGGRRLPDRLRHDGRNGNYLFDNLPPGNYLVDVYEDSITTERRAQHRADDRRCAVREPGAGAGHHLAPTSATSWAPRSRATSSGTRITTASSIDEQDSPTC